MRYVRDHISEIEASLKKRKSDYPIAELLELDKEVRRVSTELQELRAKRNKASLEISEMKKKGIDASSSIGAQHEVKAMIDAIEAKLPAQQDRIDALMWNIPNVLHESVPYGTDGSQNVELRKVGEPKTLRSASHEDILRGLDMVDLESAAKVAGARFYYLKGDLVILEQALMRFALDFLSERGYVPIEPPFMLRKEFYRGATALGDFEELLYKIADPKEVQDRKDFERLEDELFLISTSEHAIAAMHSGETLPAGRLPIRYAGISPCFRREAGAHGKDTKGIFRVHQFNKIEQFIFSRQEDSWKYFDELLSNVEGLFGALGIPYRAVDICTGDIGTVAAKKIDIEAYMPGQGDYREVASCSNCTDWQSLRLDIKYDEGGERKYVHTLNSTAIATTRAMVAIIENYAEGDGTIAMPDVLIKYMGRDRIGKRG